MRQFCIFKIILKFNILFKYGAQTSSWSSNRFPNHVRVLETERSIGFSLQDYWVFTVVQFRWYRVIDLYPLKMINSFFKVCLSFISYWKWFTHSASNFTAPEFFACFYIDRRANLVLMLYVRFIELQRYLPKGFSSSSTSEEKKDN